MSQEKVEIVRRAFVAYETGGAEGLVALTTEDVTLFSPPEWPDDAEYHGHDGVRKLSRQWTESFDEFRFTLKDVRDLGDDGVVGFGELSGRVKGSDVEIQQPVGVFYPRFRDGKVHEAHYFSSWADALAAAGLRE